MRILLVEDDDKIAAFVAQGLREAGFEVDVHTDGDSGLKAALGQEYGLAIIDLMLPGLDGLELISRMRSEGRTTPVLILSARRSVDDRVQGLQLGGDDYLTKPFSFSELLARVNALIRRSAMHAEPLAMEYGGLSLDLIKRQATRSGQSFELQPREFSLLEYFLRNPGQVLTKSMILKEIWDYDFDPQTNVVDVLVCRLRNKVDKGFDRKLIHTLRGVGYVLQDNDDI